MIAASCGSSATASASRSMVPVMTVSMLLKSCAMPPVSWPTASIFWDCRLRSSAAIVSVRSRMKPLNTVPPWRRSAVTLNSTLISLPSRRSASICRRLPEDRAFVAAQEAGEPIVMAGAMPFRHDQVAQSFSDRIVARPAEHRFAPVRSNRRLSRSRPFGRRRRGRCR